MIERRVDRIPADISTRSGRSSRGLYRPHHVAIDQFVLRGGHAIIFVDPLSELSGQQSPGQFNVEDKASSDLKAALHRLGRRLRTRPKW